MRIKITYLILFFCLSSFANSLTIKGSFKGNVNFEKVILKKYFFTIQNFKTAVLKDNTFEIQILEDTPNGVYRLFLGEQNSETYFDLIINNRENNIVFECDLDKKEGQIIFKESEENKLYYDFLNFQELYLKKISINQFYLENFPSKDEAIYSKVKNEYFNELELLKKNKELFLKKSKENFYWSNQLIKNSTFFFIQNFDQSDNDLEKLKFLNYWKDVDTTNEKLLYTPFYFDKILNFLRFYTKNNQSSYQTEIKADLTKAVDEIITSFSNNVNTKNFAISYLLTGFREIGAEDLVKYIDLRYKNILLNFLKDKDLKDYLSRLETYEKIKVGSKVPNIAWRNASNEIQDLYSINSQKTLLVFWSSECDHCKLAMPKLDQLAKDDKNITVVAIGIEWNQQPYAEEIKKYKNIWHYTDFKGWQSKVAVDYGIQATPTFYLLDQSKNMISKSDVIDKILK
ncbi:MAG: TlpA disulfide reductase family protein [Limnohabitans sp.]|nr:TlpA disulfide reductase family protein [Limnohabitans sp.]